MLAIKKIQLNYRSDQALNASTKAGKYQHIFNGQTRYDLVFHWFRYASVTIPFNRIHPNHLTLMIYAVVVASWL